MDLNWEIYLSKELHYPHKLVIGKIEIFFDTLVNSKDKSITEIPSNVLIPPSIVCNYYSTTYK